MIDHISIQCADLAASASFYDAVLAPLGGSRIMEFPGAIGYGVPPDPDFWIGALDSGDGFRESHLAFQAPDRQSVDAFFAAAVAAGAEVLHEPRLWPEYHENYYGAFVRDPDGNNVEAVCHVPVENIELETFDLDHDGKISIVESERARWGIVDARLEEIAEEGGVKGAIAEAAHKLVDKIDNDEA
jgi:catechol 2,3-dioxygenase-like lactoylglutathione lyase family enzyme